MERFNIYKRRDGRWEGRIAKGKNRNGTRQFQYFFGKTREETQKKMAEIRRKSQNGCCFLSITQLFNEWMRSIKHKVKESTAANYFLKAQKHILPAFGKMQADALESADVYSFIELKQQSGLSNRYISDIIIVMKTLFKYAVRTYHIFNPMTDIELPRKKSSDIKLLDSNEQDKLQQFIHNHQNRASLGVALSMATGIRIGELCALQWEDIDFEKRILTVRKTIQRIQTPHEKRKTKLVITEPKSESSKRKIPIPECVVEFLKKFKGKAKEFIVSGKNKPFEPRTMQYRFSKILKKTKLPSVHFHALRHIFASNCIKLGFDVKSLSELLGHSSVEITLNRYVHSSFEQKREYMKRLNLAF